MAQDIRNSTWTLWLQRFLVAIVVLFGLNIVVRSAQYLWPTLSRTEQSPEGPCSEELMVLASVLSAQQGATTELGNLFDRSVDADGDGVDALSEFLRRTSDRGPDCDNDGIPDGDDPCPNCSITDYRGLVESRLIEGLFARSGRRARQTVYVRMPWGRSLNVIDIPCRVVPSPEWHFRTVQQHFGHIPSEGISWLYLDPVVVLPGAIYIFRAKMVCGPRCGWTNLAILIDVPLAGPVYVGAKNLWIS